MNKNNKLIENIIEKLKEKINNLGLKSIFINRDDNDDIIIENTDSKILIKELLLSISDKKIYVKNVSLYTLIKNIPDLDKDDFFSSTLKEAIWFLYDNKEYLDKRVINGSDFYRYDNVWSYISFFPSKDGVTLFSIFNSAFFFQFHFPDITHNELLLSSKELNEKAGFSDSFSIEPFTSLDSFMQKFKKMLDSYNIEKIWEKIRSDIVEILKKELNKYLDYIEKRS